MKDIVFKLEFLLNEIKKIKKGEDESITTVSAGVPGDGPIADVQNGLSITQKDKEAIDKNKKLLKSFMFSRVHEGNELSIDELLSVLDISNIIKTTGKDFNKIFEVVQKKLNSLKSQLHITLSNNTITELKDKIKNMV